MRPVVVSAVLLVVLMFMSGSTARNPEQMCREKYPITPCKENIGEGWFQMGDGRCVKAVRDHLLSFYEAESACRRYRNGFVEGHLVSIHSADELHHVECAMYRLHTGKDHYWIGYERNTDDAFAHYFEWIDGSLGFYNNWSRGEPNFYLFREYCVEMNYWDWGLWNDEDCRRRKAYVCAIMVE